MDKPESQPKHGWYADPEDPNQLRFWDGTSWTRLTKSLPAEEPYVTAPAGEPYVAAPAAAPAAVWPSAYSWQSQVSPPPRTGAAAHPVRVTFAVLAGAAVLVVAFAIGVGSLHPRGSLTPLSAPTASAVPRANLKCPSNYVTVAGAPFCYALPASFVNISASARYSETAPYRSMIQFLTATGLSTRDVIVVYARQIPPDLSGLTIGDYVSLVFQDRPAVGTDSITAEGPVGQVRVNGGEGVQYTITYGNGDHTRLTEIFNGDTEAIIKCQGSRNPTAIAAGCRTVLGTIRTVPL